MARICSEMKNDLKTEETFCYVFIKKHMASWVVITDGTMPPPVPFKSFTYVILMKFDHHINGTTAAAVNKFQIFLRHSCV